MQTHPLRLVPGNAAVAYYVDVDSCTCCGLCYGMTPDLFRFSEDLGVALVLRQPQTPKERTAADEAMALCPMGAIHSDGEVPRSAVVPMQPPESNGNPEVAMPDRL